MSGPAPQIQPRYYTRSSCEGYAVGWLGVRLVCYPPRTMRISCSHYVALIAFAPLLLLGGCVLTADTDLPQVVLSGGSAAIYEACSVSLGGCADGLACVGPTSQPSGFCAESCASDGDCTAVGDSDGVCILSFTDGDTPTLCALLCDEAGGCPEGTACTLVDDTRLCLP